MKNKNKKKITFRICNAGLKLVRVSKRAGCMTDINVESWTDKLKFRACLLHSLSHKHPCKRHEYVSSPPSPSYGANSWLPSLERKREKATRNNSTIFHKNDNKEEESVKKHNGSRTCATWFGNVSEGEDW